VFSSGIALCTKASNAFDIPMGRVYISQDVIFDKNVFLFANLHSNAGAQLQSEILVLPPAHLNPNSFDHRGEVIVDHVSNVSNQDGNNTCQIMFKSL
jgi:hypothetical protein